LQHRTAVIVDGVPACDAVRETRAWLPREWDGKTTAGFDPAQQALLVRR